MVRPVYIEFENAFYHVASRGINRQDLFLDSEDNNFFIALLRKLVLKFEIRLFAFCLMTNHYHLYLSTPNANLSKFVKALNQAYAIYFLSKYPDKNGSVFKGRYMRRLVDGDSYSMTLIAYVHNNPHKLVTKIEDWRYSSYQSFFNPEARFDFIDYDFTMSNFAGSIKSFEEFHKYMKKTEWNPENHTIAKSFIGSEEFVERIVNQYLDLEIITNEEILGMSYFRQKLRRDEILLKIRAMDLEAKLRVKFEIYILKEYCGYSLKELKSRYCKNTKTISELLRLFRKQLSVDKERQAILEEILKTGILGT